MSPAAQVVLIPVRPAVLGAVSEQHDVSPLTDGEPRSGPVPCVPALTIQFASPSKTHWLRPIRGIDTIHGIGPPGGRRVVRRGGVWAPVAGR